MKIGFLDFEATSSDPFTAKILEIGILIYDVTHGRMVKSYQTLVNWNEPVPSEAAQINGITTEVMGLHGIPPLEAMAKLQGLIKECDYLCAHNGFRYDFPLYQTTFKKMYNVDAPMPTLIDTMFDLPYPKNIETRKLSYLLAEHGMLNPDAHTALADCMGMMALFKKYNAKEVLEIAAYPLVTMVANVNYDTKDQAKKRGYSWEASEKIWVKTLRGFYLDKEQADSPFKITLRK
jgi:DNA polymerase-3 subunit epsilon